MQRVPGWPSAFRGSAAVAAGLVTRWGLGQRFVRIFPDVYVSAAHEVGLWLSSRAAFELVRGVGMLAGHSAALVHGAECAPLRARPEVIVPGGGPRAHPGMVLHRDRLHTDEIVQVERLRTRRPRLEWAPGTLVTTAARTAYDLARWAPNLTEAVVAVDRLANVCRFDPAQVLAVAQRHPRARGRRRLAEVVALADARSGSPMETRLRLLLVEAGLPRPEVQYVVQDPVSRTAVWLDLAYPEHRIAIEYEGADHTRADRVLSDAGRYTALVARGWRIFRFTKRDMADPARVVVLIRQALLERISA